MPQYCVEEGCTTRASYNKKGIKQPKYCNQHKKNGMISVDTRMCLECDKRPCCNYPNEKKAIYCSKHKKNGMVNISEKRMCLECDKRPCCNYPNEKKAIYCSKHKKDGMVNVIKDNCLECDKTPSYNYKGEKKAIYCSKHKKDGMVNVKSKRCLECDLIPSYNIESEKNGVYCNQHKKSGMINVIDNRCLECDKISNYNYPNKKKGIYCNQHKKSGMVDVLNKMCKICEKTKAIKHYDYHCFTCFKYTYPNHPIIRKNREKERSVCGELQRRYSHINLIFNKSIEGGCSKRRPDCFIELYTHTIIIEVDENQHYNYSCEEQRINDLYTDLGDRPLILIRINPDKYKDENGNIIRGIFSFDKENNIKIYNKKEYQHRIDVLCKTIDEYLIYRDDIVFKEIKLFYDK